MGFFDIFRRKNRKNDFQERKAEEPQPEKPQLEAPQRESAMGWDAITNAFEQVYPGQRDPKHYGTLIKWRLGGNDPLDGISIYDGGDYWHFVTYGLSELYEKESQNMDVSGYGMEFTFKLKKRMPDAGQYHEAEEAEIRCICGILQAVARMTYKDGEMFLPYQYLYTGQKEGIDAERQSNITGFITIPDTDVKPVATLNGRVEFVEFIGVTDAELRAVHGRMMSVNELYEKLGTDVTSYSRDSVV